MRAVPKVIGTTPVIASTQVGGWLQPCECGFNRCMMAAEYCAGYPAVIQRLKSLVWDGGIPLLGCGFCADCQ